jgi:DNA processing protein
MVTEASDIVSVLAPMLRLRETEAACALAPCPGPVAAATPAQQPLALGTCDRARILEALGPAPIDLDTLARATGLGSRALQIALIELALAGEIERHGQQLVSRKP